MENQELQVRPDDPASLALSVQAVKNQINLIQNIMKEAMKKDEHYGVIPGTGTKPTLLKAGAEKLCLTFRLAPEFDVNERDLPGGHREIRVTTTLKHIPTGRTLGQGIGSCSTMETKYRYRSGAGENTGEAVPHEYWDLRKKNPAKAKEMAGELMPKKTDSGWFWFTKVEKVENPDLADVYNTVAKMAKKRSLVDAVLTATAASDIFVQDLEDTVEVTETAKPVAKEVATPEVASVKTGEDAKSPEEKSRAKFWGRFKALCPDIKIQRKIVLAIRKQESTAGMSAIEEAQILDAAADYAKSQAEVQVQEAEIVAEGARMKKSEEIEWGK